MRTSTFVALAAAELVAGHATFQSFVIGGKDQGQHTAVRTPSNSNNPIYDVTSTAMICNGGTAASDTIEVTSGQEITMQWHHNDPATTSGDNDEPIASSHKGPVMVYIAPADSNGEGAVWVKLYEDGYNSGTWGVDNFIANKGQITITLPDLAAGDYLIRPEIIALHEAQTEGRAQFYNGCGQIKVTSSGSATLPSGVDMTKAYSATDPGVMVNIYSGLTSYEIPGPALWDGASSGSSGSGSSASATATATKTAAATSAAANSAAATSAAATSAAATSAAATSAAATSAAATSAAATSAATTCTTATSAAAISAAATSTVQDVATPTSTQAAQSSATGGSSSTLPETFTIQEFISWLETTTGTANAKRFINSIGRKHAREFL